MNALVPSDTARKISLVQLIREHPFPMVVLPERMVWTSSAIKLFRKCKRKFFWKYIMGLRPRYRSGPLLIGSVFHEALAHWYRGRGSSMRAIAARYAKTARDEAVLNAEFYGEDEYDKLSAIIESLVGMLTGYADIYGSDRDAWVIIRRQIELQFKVNCGEFDFQGKIDLLASKRKNTKPFLVEHKTASSIGDSYMDRLPLDTQIRGYIFGCDRGHGILPTEVLYDVVRKCKLRRKSNEKSDQFNERIALDYASRPSFYFYREPLKFGRSDIAAFEHELHSVHRQYMSIANGEYGDPTNPRTWDPNDGTCNEFFKTCEYLQLDNIGLDRGTAMSFIHQPNMHEELAEEL